jgi:hypothetical protein
LELGEGEQHDVVFVEPRLDKLTFCFSCGIPQASSAKQAVNFDVS